MSKERPNFSRLKPEAPPPAVQAEASGSYQVPPSRKGTRLVDVHVPKAVWRMLHSLALDEESSIQKLGIEALNDLFAKWGKPRIAG
jgi:hypothetical protein